MKKNYSKNSKIVLNYEFVFFTFFKFSSLIRVYDMDIGLITWLRYVSLQSRIKLCQTFILYDIKRLLTQFHATLLFQDSHVQHNPLFEQKWKISIFY